MRKYYEQNPSEPPPGFPMERTVTRSARSNSSPSRRNIYRGLVHFRYPNKYKGCRRVTEHGSSVRMLSERECEKLREFVQRCVDSRLVEA